MILGIVLFSMSDNITEMVVDYTDCDSVNNVCTLSFEIQEDIEGPVFVYYQLENYFQNHRRYVKSMDYKQLMGEPRTPEEVGETCTPMVYNANLTVEYSVNGTPLEPLAPANPCGLIAWSIFNDSYAVYNTDPNSLTNPSSALIEIDDSNIAWTSDVENKYKNCEGCTYLDGTEASSWEDVQWLDVTDPHFIVWMKTAGLPNFRKLWGQIGQTLTAGTYWVQIGNTYSAESFNGKKSFVLSTTNSLGGKNYFLATCYIVVGAICIVSAIIFLVAKMTQSKKANANIR